MSVFNPPYQDFMVVCSEKLTCFLGSCAKHSLPEPGESSIGVKKALKRLANIPNAFSIILRALQR